MRGFTLPKKELVALDNLFLTEAKRRWMHLHVRDLVPTHVIRRGRGPVSILPVKRVKIADIQVSDPNVAGEKIGATAWFKRRDRDAFWVMHNGNIVHEEYSHGMRDDQPHFLWSATKSIPVGVVANLIHEGKRKEHGQITDYIPELKGTGYEGATIRHCLDMRSGVGWADKSPKETRARWQKAIGFTRKLPEEPLDEGQYHALMTFPEFRLRLVVAPVPYQLPLHSSASRLSPAARVARTDLSCAGHATCCPGCEAPRGSQGGPTPSRRGAE